MAGKIRSIVPVVSLRENVSAVFVSAPQGRVSSDSPTNVAYTVTPRPRAEFYHEFSLCCDDLNLEPLTPSNFSDEGALHIPSQGKTEEKNEGAKHPITIPLAYATPVSYPIGLRNTRQQSRWPTQHQVAIPLAYATPDSNPFGLRSTREQSH